MQISKSSDSDPTLRPLEEILRGHQPILLRLDQKLLDIFNRIFQTMQHSVMSMDDHFREWRYVTVRNLIDSELRHEKSLEEGYRDQIGIELLRVRLLPEEDQCMAVLQLQQTLADTEAGRATKSFLIETDDLLDENTIKFIPLRFLQYATEGFEPQKRKQLQEEWKNLDNAALRRLFVEACRKPPSLQKTWAELAFEWLKRSWDNPSTPNDAIDIRYCMERRALLIASLVDRYFKRSKATPEFSKLTDAMLQHKKDFDDWVAPKTQTCPEGLDSLYQDMRDLLASTETLKDMLEKIKDPNIFAKMRGNPHSPPIQKHTLRTESPRTQLRVATLTQGNHSPFRNSLPPSPPHKIAGLKQRAGTGSRASPILTRADSSSSVASPPKRVIRVDSNSPTDSRESTPQRQDRHLGNLSAYLIIEIRLMTHLVEALENMLEKPKLPSLPIIPTPILFFDFDHPEAPYADPLLQMVDMLELLCSFLSRAN